MIKLQGNVMKKDGESSEICIKFLIDEENAEQATKELTELLKYMKVETD